MIHKKECVDIRKTRDASKDKAKAIYKEISGERNDDDGENKSKPKPKLKLPTTMPMALWSNGLGERQYEWLVDCYRMRVDDDCTHGGGKRHGACLLVC